MEMEETYEIPEKNNGQEIYENVNGHKQEEYTGIDDIDRQASYLELDQSPVQQEEYANVDETNIKSSKPVKKPKPTLLPRKSNEQQKEVIYQNAPIGSQKDKKDAEKIKKYKEEPRYTKAPEKHIPEDELYVNERDSRQYYENSKKEKHEERRIVPELAEKPQNKKPLQQKSWKKRHIIIITVVVLLLIFFAIGFIAAWFGKGNKNEEKNLASKCSFQNQPKPDQGFKKGSQAKTSMFITEPGNNLPETSKTELNNKITLGMPVRVAYLQDPTDTKTWTYADGNLFSPADNNNELCIQLYKSVTNTNPFINSLAYEWSFVCINSWVHTVVYAISTGQAINSSTYQSPMKWYVRGHTPQVLYTDVNPSENNKHKLGEYISQGHDIYVATYSSFQRLTGYFSSNFAQLLFNDTATTQSMHLSVKECNTTCKFNLQNVPMDYIVIDQAATVSKDNWNIMRFAVESYTSKGFTSHSFNTTWAVYQCWKTVHETTSDNTNKDHTNQELLNAIKLGHRVRVAIKHNDGTVTAFEPHLLIVKDKQVYGLNIWKTRVLSTDRTKQDPDGYWDWTIVSTTGNIVQQFCRIGLSHCQKGTMTSNFTSIKWTIDTNDWSPIYQKSFPKTESTCGNFEEFITKAKDGKAIRYMINDSVSNIQYFHQIHNIHIHDSDEVVIQHMNEALLQWDSKHSTYIFAPTPTLIWRQISSSGNLLQTMWTYGSQPSLYRQKYNYVSDNKYNITWFAQT